MEAVAADPEQAVFRPLAGWSGRLASTLSVALSLYALYWVLFIVQPQVYRVSFLLIVLVLTFLLVPATAAARRSTRVPIPDWVLIAASVVALAWPLLDFSRFVYRAAEPLPIDLVLGTLTTILVLEASRRTVGWILPVTAIGFLLYAWLGPWFDRVGLSLIAHRGYGLDRLIGTLYMSLEGIFGVPLDVTATYIILFTIFGAVLERTGAGRFFVEWALSVAGRSPAAGGRAVTLAGFLLGTVSGSGVATTVMLGSVAWPMLRRAGYAAETAAAMLSAAGIGALLSPPTLGAAAFLIAEFLQISYLQVLLMATVPTVLYYLSIFVMIEGTVPETGAGTVSDAKTVTGTVSHYFHFISLVAIGALLATGMSAFKAVFWATLTAAAVSYLRTETALTPRRALDALRSGGHDILSVAATTATAGIIVGVVTLTGLGLEISGVIVTLAGGTQFLTVIYAGIAIWLLGLAVPVTASYIIAAVMVAPALIRAGVPDFAAHMFIFYYAVLSEVSPPTALSPFAAAALTGANPLRTMILTWRYTLPAFVVPLIFTLAPGGIGILLRGSPATIALAVAAGTVGIATLAAAMGGWAGSPIGSRTRALLGLSGVMSLSGYPWAIGIGTAMAGLVLILHRLEHKPVDKPATRR